MEHLYTADGAAGGGEGGGREGGRELVRLFPESRTQTLLRARRLLLHHEEEEGAVSGQKAYSPLLHHTASRVFVTQLRCHEATRPERSAPHHHHHLLRASGLLTHLAGAWLADLLRLQLIRPVRMMWRSCFYCEDSKYSRPSPNHTHSLMSRWEEPGLD